MAVGLVTLHAFGTWFPDRTAGFTRRRAGWRPPSPVLNRAYRAAMNREAVEFTPSIQRLLIDEFLASSPFLEYEPRVAATDPTHIHLLLSWRDDRVLPQIAPRLRTSLSQRLNQELGSRTWFVKGCSKRRVLKQEHWDYLVNEYLPGHPGWKWDYRQGYFR